MSLLQYSSNFCGNQRLLWSQTQLSSANILRYYVHIFTVSVIVCNKTTQIGKRINQNRYVLPGLLDTSAAQFDVGARRPATFDLAPSLLIPCPYECGCPTPRSRERAVKIVTPSPWIFCRRTACNHLGLSAQLIHAVPLRVSLTWYSNRNCLIPFRGDKAVKIVTAIAWGDCRG